MKSRTKYLSVAAAVMLCGAAFADQKTDTIISFSTSSLYGDKYADGTYVLENEWYALCWSDDAEFGGITADGKASASGDEVLVILPLAQRTADGKGYCPKTIVAIDSGFKSSGYFFVYLLDTRTSATTVSEGDKPGVINSALQVVGAQEASPTRYTISNVDTREFVHTESVLPAGVSNPQVVGIDPVGEEVVISVEGMSPAVRYNVRKGASVSKVEDLSKKTPITGAADGGLVKISLKKDDARFFKVVRQPLTTTTDDYVNAED